jgi:hypothetical protein
MFKVGIVSDLARIAVLILIGLPLITFVYD